MAAVLANSASSNYNHRQKKRRDYDQFGKHINDEAFKRGIETLR